MARKRKYDLHIPDELYDSRKAAQKRLRQRVRAKVLNLLGPFCRHCLFDDLRALQIDHIEGGGTEDRSKKESVSAYYKRVTESHLRGEGKYQVLCANCNVIKRVENSENRKA